MIKQVYYFSGWACNSRVFDQIHELFKDYDRVDVDTSSLEVPMDSPYNKVVVTWSYGYLHFLDTSHKLSHIKAIIALAPTHKLLESTKQGVNHQLVDQMINDMTSHPGNTLDQFYGTLNKGLSLVYRSQASYQTLLNSLSHLSYLDKSKVTVACPMYIFHGLRDPIIPITLGHVVHRKHKNTHFYPVQAKHFLLDHPRVIQGIEKILRSTL
jgi:pimeloyl-ACP methyl ester carboxylesterase